MMGGGGFSTLLTLAALQENGGNAAAGGPASAGVAAAAAAAAVAAAAAAVSVASSTGTVPLPPSLDPHRTLPVTPTTPTSTGEPFIESMSFLRRIIPYAILLHGALCHLAYQCMAHHMG